MRRACRNLKAELRQTARKAADTQSALQQLTGDLARAWDLPDGGGGGGAPSERSRALQNVHAKWCSGDAPAAAEHDDVSATMRRQVAATEVKADLAEFRTQRMRTVAQASVSQKVRENMDILNENASLRREVHALQKRLAALEGTTAPARSVSPGARGDQGSAEALQGAASRLGGIPAPSRPVSGVSAAASSRPASALACKAPRPQLRRPHSATALPSSHALQGGEGAAARRPWSCDPAALRKPAPTTGASQRIVRYRPAHVLREMAQQGAAHDRGLQAALDGKDRQLEEQQAQMRVLQAMVQQKILEESDLDGSLDGSDGADEVVYAGEAEVEPIAPVLDSGDKATTPHPQPRRPRPQSAVETRRSAGAWGKDTGAAGRLARRRPTSAGGANVNAARSALRAGSQERC